MSGVLAQHSTISTRAANCADALGEPAAARLPRRRGKSAALTQAYRLEIASRSLAAVLGGFFLASAVAVLLAALLVAMDLQARGPAVVTGTFLSWLVWAGATVWAFYARRQASAWVWIVGPAAAAGALALLLGTGS